jgi:hypothetical protein
LLSTEDGFEEGILEALVGVCGTGNDIVKIFKDVQDIY